MEQKSCKFCIHKTVCKFYDWAMLQRFSSWTTGDLRKLVGKFEEKLASECSDYKK